MAQSFWLINSNRSEVRRFIKNTANKDRFFEYMFVDSGKIVGVLGKEPPVMTKREELKIDNARDEYKKLLNYDPYLITDKYNMNHQIEGFNENRHDQSVFSLIVKTKISKNDSTAFKIIQSKKILNDNLRPHLKNHPKK